MKELLWNIGGYWYNLTDRALMRISAERWERLPMWVRLLCQAVNIRPDYEPITREMEMSWDYRAMMNNHK